MTVSYQRLRLWSHSLLEPLFFIFVLTGLGMSTYHYPVPGDPSEFARLSITLGVAHPTGYPLYILFAALTCRLIFFIESIWVANFVSALMMFATVFALSRLLKELRVSFEVRAICVLLLIQTPEIFRYSNFAEVYTLHAFLAATIALCLVKAVHRTDSRYTSFAIFLGGLALGNHMSAVLLYPSLVLLILYHAWHRGWLAQRLFWLSHAGMFLFGATILSAPILFDYLQFPHYIDLFLLEYPDAVPQNLFSRWIWTITAQQYNAMSLTLTDLLSLSQLLKSSALAITYYEQNTALTILGSIGLLYGLSIARVRIYAIALVLSIVLQLLYFSTYRAFEPIFLIHSFLWLTLGAALILHKCSSRIKGLLWVVLIILCLRYQNLVHEARHWAVRPPTNLSSTEAFLKAAAPRSILLSSWELGTLAQYIQVAKGIGRRVRVIAADPASWTTIAERKGKEGRAVYFEKLPIESERSNCFPELGMYRCLPLTPLSN